jgi:hypothetical protein
MPENIDFVASGKRPFNEDIGEKTTNVSPNKDELNNIFTNFQCVLFILTTQ